MKRHFLHCFIDDKYGLQNLQYVGEDNAAYETDYPHSDALWPEVPEYLYESVKHLTDAQIDKVTHGNAIRWFKHDSLWANNKREDMTVAACRARAKAKGVDTSPKSSGGAKPAEDARPITSGDIMDMFKKHAAERNAA